MDNKKSFLKLILIVAGFIIAVVFFVYLARLNMILANSKKYGKLLQGRLIIAEENYKGCRNLLLKDDSTEKKAWDFLNWQFVIREQRDAQKIKLEEALKKLRGKDRNVALNLIYYATGLNAMAVYDFNNAITYFEQALKYDNKDSEANYSLGLLYAAYRNNTSKALYYYKKYLEIAPNGAHADIVEQRIIDLKNGKDKAKNE